MFALIENAMMNTAKRTNRNTISPKKRTKFKSLKFHHCITKLLYLYIVNFAFTNYQYRPTIIKNLKQISKNDIITRHGEIPKWPKGAVSKTARGCKSREGSTPSFSARN